MILKIFEVVSKVEEHIAYSIYKLSSKQLFISSTDFKMYKSEVWLLTCRQTKSLISLFFSVAQLQPQDHHPHGLEVSIIVETLKTLK